MMEILACLWVVYLSTRPSVGRARRRLAGDCPRGAGRRGERPRLFHLLYEMGMTFHLVWALAMAVVFQV